LAVHSTDPSRSQCADHRAGRDRGEHVPDGFGAVETLDRKCRDKTRGIPNTIATTSMLNVDWRTRLPFRYRKPASTAVTPRSGSAFGSRTGRCGRNISTKAMATTYDATSMP
jgi:hypothetical protein